MAMAVEERGRFAPASDQTAAALWCRVWASEAAEQE